MRRKARQRASGSPFSRSLMTATDAAPAVDHRRGVVERDAADRHDRQALRRGAADALRDHRRRPTPCSRCPSCRCRTPDRSPGRRSARRSARLPLLARVRGQAENRRRRRSPRAHRPASDPSWPTCRPCAPRERGDVGAIVDDQRSRRPRWRLRGLIRRDRETRRLPWPCSAAEASARPPRETRARRRAARGPRRAHTSASTIA